MLYTVAEVSDLIGLSKVSIYKKLKLKELRGHIIKKGGLTYLDDGALNLIKNTLKLNDSETYETDNTVNDEGEKYLMNIGDLSIKTDYINTLKKQLDRKDAQIKELIDRLQQEQELHRNQQILLKCEQNKNGSLLLLRRDKKKKKKFWKRVFNI